MTIHMDAGYANAQIDSAIIARFRLLDHLRKRIVQKPDGTYEPLIFAERTNFGTLRFDPDLIGVYRETCARSGGRQWLKLHEEQRGKKRYLVPSKIADEAIEAYRKRRGIEPFTAEVILG